MVGSAPLGSIVLAGSGASSSGGGGPPPSYPTDFGDTLTVGDAMSTGATELKTDALVMAELSAVSRAIYATDAITALGSATASQFLQVLESIAIGSAGQNTIVATNAASDAVTLQVAAGIAYRLFGEDVLAMADTGVPRTRMIVRAIDLLLAAGVANHTLQAIHQLSSALAADAVARIVQMEEVTDAMVVGELTAHQLRAYQRAIEAIVAADTATMRVRFTVVGVDAVAMADTGATTARLLEAIADGLTVVADIALEDGRHVAWVVNAATSAAWSYSNYGFNSFATFDGRHYGAKDDGIYLLEGDTDAGAAIRARLRTGPMDFGTSSVKRPAAMYLMAKRTGELALKVVVTNEDARQEVHWYRLEGGPARVTRQDKVPALDKGLETVDFEFELVNLDGADFDVDSWQMLPMITSRRV